jgi:hypothetical protein
MGSAVLMSPSLCLECGRVIVGDECQSPQCAARLSSVKKARDLYLFVGGAGLLGMVISAFRLYPTLEHKSVARLLVLLFLVATIVNLALDDRYAKFTRIMYLVVTAVMVVSATVYFLNGALDRHIPTEVKATVIGKVASRGQGGGDATALTVMWHQTQKQIVENFKVSRQTFATIEPGDSVYLIVHQGAFSMPWYGGLLSSKPTSVPTEKR